MSRKSRSAGLVLLLTATLAVAGCESLGYYTQAISGQFYLLTHRENINRLIDDSATPDALRHKLETVLEIREFASVELGLPLGKTFSSYADIERPYVVWNVFATPEFSMTPEKWCYPVAGCVSYRGYFSEDRAREYAQKLKEKGLDVYVGGVSAYSTLGWFDDPLLNTVIGREDHQLASLIFHELAHQQVYLSGDTDFNESYATAVEREGLRRWLQTRYSDEQSNQLLAEIQAEFNRREQFVALVQSTAKALETLYSSAKSDAAMREEKQQILAALQSEYQELRNSWNGYSGYDAWFSRPLNNAQLSTVATYFRWVDAFERLSALQGNDLGRFYQEVEALAALDNQARQQRLERLQAESD